ncbi:hypothetical protein ES708_29648 [subsurface metagenome]
MRIKYGSADINIEKGKKDFQCGSESEEHWSLHKTAEMQNQCAKIKIRAERKAGGILKEEIKLGGNPMLHDVTLKDLSIERIQSHRWQNIASIPEE